MRLAKVSVESRRGWDAEDTRAHTLDLDAACAAMEFRFGPEWRETTTLEDVRALTADLRDAVAVAARAIGCHR